MINRAFDDWFKNIEKRPALAVTVSILWLIIIAWIAYGWNLGSIGLIDETEPLFAEASRQMLITGDWITPFFNGETRFDKPALIYWCQALAYAILGVNEWAVRIPSAIAAMSVVSLGFYTLQCHQAKQDLLEQVYHPRKRWLTASLGAAIMAFNVEMLVWGRTGVSDMLLTGCIASANLCFFLGYAEKKKETSKQFFRLPSKWYLACYVLIAGAILTKGPVGIVLPGLIILAFLIYVGKVREVLREMRPLIGMLIIFGLSAPWYVLVIWRNGWNYINSFFGYHNLERFTEVVNGHSAPWYFYFIVVLLGFAPYSIYLPTAIARLKFWQRSHWRSQERFQQLSLFAFIWFACVFGFFTTAVTKLPSYVLPLMPAAAILVALFWSDFFKDKETAKREEGERGGQGRQESNFSPLSPRSPSSPSSLQASGWVNVVFLSALGVAMFYVPRLLGKDPAAPDLSERLQQLNLPAIGGAIWLLSAVAIAFFIIRRRWLLIIPMNLLGFVLFLAIALTPTLFLIDSERQLPLRELSAIAVQAKQPGEELVMVGFKKPTIVFYTHEKVNFIKITEKAVEHIQKQTASKVQPPSLLIIAQPKRLVQMGLQPSNYENLGSKGAYQLIRVSW
jgi:4-amino-4-deoxy-L-arabinose transferase-like glycosyltransferase